MNPFSTETRKLHEGRRTGTSPVINYNRENPDPGANNYPVANRCQSTKFAPLMALLREQGSLVWPGQLPKFMNFNA